MLAASDGSGDHPKEERLRRCGYALYYGDGHPWDVERPLRGQVQTVPRAELRIFLDVIPRLQVPTTVKCDCLGVVTGMRALLRGKAVERKYHADIWDLIESRLRGLPDRSILEVEKVKAHVTRKQMEDGEIDEVSWTLNDEVDEMAERDGKLYCVTEPVVKGLQRRVASTVLVQKMYTDILVERHAELQRLQKQFPVGREGAEDRYKQYLVGDLDLGAEDPLTRAAVPMRERDEERTIGRTRADLATRFGFTSQWRPATGRMRVDTVDELGAAGAGGLRAEDVIQTVNRASTVEMTDEEWRTLLRGEGAGS